MYEITSWLDLSRIAPAGARFFRYRRPTGARRKFYEDGRPFPLEPEQLEDRKPAHSDGVYAVCFYTEEEAQKPPAEARPMVIKPPDFDEVLVEFPRGLQPGDSGDSLYKREQLITIKDMARSATAGTDVLLKLIEKISHERDVMAEEAEKNRIGPMWQLILEHHQEIKGVLLAAVPIVAAIAKAGAERLTNGGEVGSAIGDLRQSQAKLEALVTRFVEHTDKALVSVGKDLARIEGAIGAKRALPPAPRKKAGRARK